MAFWENDLVDFMSQCVLGGRWNEGGVRETETDLYFSVHFSHNCPKPKMIKYTNDYTYTYANRISPQTLEILFF